MSSLVGLGEEFGKFLLLEHGGGQCSKTRVKSLYSWERQGPSDAREVAPAELGVGAVDVTVGLEQLRGRT